MNDDPYTEKAQAVDDALYSLWRAYQDMSGEELLRYSNELDDRAAEAMTHGGPWYRLAQMRWYFRTVGLRRIETGGTE